jgi:hypothetical protein
VKEELLRLFELKDHTEAEQGWKRWFDAAINSPVPAPAKFGRQKLKRLDDPVAHASFSVNTGKPEGFNNKIKAAKRNARGFRNLSFFLLYQIPFNSQNNFLNPKKNMKNLIFSLFVKEDTRKCRLPGIFFFTGLFLQPPFNQFNGFFHCIIFQHIKDGRIMLRGRMIRPLPCSVFSGSGKLQYFIN